MAKKKQEPPKLTVVENLHGNVKEPINNIIDRLDSVLRDFADQTRAGGSFITTAEVVGILECLKHDYLTGRR